MAIPERTGHIAVCVDKYLLVWGGYQELEGGQMDKYLPPEELWVYNIETKAWQNVSVSRIRLLHIQEEFPLGMSGATANLLNGCLYVFGGHTMYGNNNYLLKLDLVQCEWGVVVSEAERPQPSPRDKLVSWVYGDNLYYFGGYGPSLLGFLRENGEFVGDDTSFLGIPRGWNNQLLVFNTLSETWSNPKCKGPVPSARAAHAAARVGNTVYLFGGRHRHQRLGDLHQLNLDNLTWSGELHTHGRRPVGRSWHTLTVVSDTQLFLYGGYTQDNQTLGDAWVLDVALLQWTQLRLAKNRPRLWHTCCVTSDKDLLVFGGCCNDILDQTIPTKHCNEILEFRLSPKSLLRLCVDAAFDYRDVCEVEWTCLPKHLMDILQLRLEAWNVRDREVKQAQQSGDQANRGQTCVIS